jgi:hypothetical protein
MKLFLVYRNDNIGHDEYGSAIVAAESPEEVIEILKDSVAENFGAPKEEVWGNYDVTVKEIVLDKPRIILQFPAG